MYNFKLYSCFKTVIPYMALKILLSLYLFDLQLPITENGSHSEDDL